MPASNTKIKKICEWCGTRFEAQKISTKYCSHRCANLAYKKREREKNIKATEENTQNRIEELPIITIKDKEFLSFSEVGILLGITRQAVYKMVYKGYLQASKISSRLSFVKRSDIDEMLTYIIHSGFISGYQNRYGDNLKPPTNVYHRMTA